MSGLLTKLK